VVDKSLFHHLIVFPINVRPTLHNTNIPRQEFDILLLPSDTCLICQYGAIQLQTHVSGAHQEISQLLTPTAITMNLHVPRQDSAFYETWFNEVIQERAMGCAYYIHDYILVHSINQNSWRSGPWQPGTCLRRGNNPGIPRVLHSV